MFILYNKTCRSCFAKIREAIEEGNELICRQKLFWNFSGSHVTPLKEKRRERERVRCVRVRERRIVVDTKTYICKFLIGLEEEK